jgi:hypothetical protein
MRVPAKLQELQIVLACILRISLESIVITDIQANSISLPFDASIPRLNSNGEIVCINLPPVLPVQSAQLRRLQTADVAVSYNILDTNNIFMMDKKSFADSVATDPTMISYASSVGSGNPTAIPPLELFTLISPDPPTPPAQSASAGSIVGGIFGGILIAGVLIIGALFVSARLRNRTPPITANKKPSLTVSNPLNFTSSSQVTFSPVPTRRSA